MSWRTATKSLHALGGGPTQRREFWPPSKEGATKGSALNKARHMGMMTCANVGMRWYWTLTKHGRDWCEGRIADHCRNQAPPIDREAVLRRLAFGVDHAVSVVSKLTTRQRDVLVFVACGLTSREIGALLKITPKTAEAHRAGLMRRLGCERATEAAVLATKAGLV